MKLEQLIDHHDLGDLVELFGPATNAQIREMMRNCDLFVLPCRVATTGDKDGIPVVLMEAMASGVCVISGDLPSIRELVADDETGAMVEPGEVAALVSAIERLASNPTDRARLAAAGRGRVVAEFSAEVNLERIASALSRSLLSEQDGINAICALESDNTREGHRVELH